MAEITRVTPSLASHGPSTAYQVGSGLVAGEALVAGDCCYIKSDGLVWKSDGSAADALAKADGMTPVAASVGEAVTIYRNCDFHYAAGMTPGARLYVGATPGLLDTAATTGGTAPVGFVVSATRIRFVGSNY
jgi:hypothetical protein